jgi:predicted GIY-YIG superfamily endonuclease
MDSGSKGYHTYIAQLSNGQLYVGVTDNLERRSTEHAGGKPSTRTSRVFGFRRIIYSELHPDKASGLKRERQLKRWTHAKKKALVVGDVQILRRLARRKQSGQSSSE